MLGRKQAYRRFVQDGLSEGHKKEYYAVEDQSFLGGEGFGERLLKKKRAWQVKIRRGLSRWERELAKLLKIGVQALLSPDRGWAHLLVRRLGYRSSDATVYFGRDIATLATLLARLGDRTQANDTARQEVDRLIG